MWESKILHARCMNFNHLRTNFKCSQVSTEECQRQIGLAQQVFCLLINQSNQASTFFFFKVESHKHDCVTREVFSIFSQLVIIWLSASCNVESMGQGEGD